LINADAEFGSIWQIRTRLLQQIFDFLGLGEDRNEMDPAYQQGHRQA